MAAALLIVAPVLCFFKREKTKKNKVDHDSDDERRKKDEAAKKQDNADNWSFVNGQEDGANAPQSRASTHYAGQNPAKMQGPPQGILVEPESSLGQTASYRLPVNVPLRIHEVHEQKQRHTDDEGTRPPQGIPVEPESSLGQTDSYLLQPVNVPLRTHEVHEQKQRHTDDEGTITTTL